MQNGLPNLHFRRQALPRHAAFEDRPHAAFAAMRRSDLALDFIACGSLPAHSVTDELGRFLATVAADDLNDHVRIVHIAGLVAAGEIDDPAFHATLGLDAI